MSSSKKEKNFEQILCPVCKKIVHADDLPDRDSVITDDMYYKSGIQMVDSEVRIHREFVHMHDGKGDAPDEFHELIAIISAHFDGTGKCTLFEIIKIILKEGD